MRRGVLKRAICDLQGRGGRWTSKCDNIRGTRIVVSLLVIFVLVVLIVAKLWGGVGSSNLYLSPGTVHTFILQELKVLSSAGQKYSKNFHGGSANSVPLYSPFCNPHCET